MRWAFENPVMPGNQRVPLRPPPSHHALWFVLFVRTPHCLSSIHCLGSGYEVTAKRTSIWCSSFPDALWRKSRAHL
ncbi:hypothetical protein DPEC_G00104570 [Dallia pectoralis]|uniref:Uncharacterized protein n=1 Tax=Dallia pectoralis TaxID=75939 RepID=A0ACC2GXF6_DALPE|nr:hypothetical protein DPEC_G00104570 [Dallia pectoralis]